MSSRGCQQGAQPESLTEVLDGGEVVSEQRTRQSEHLCRLLCSLDSCLRMPLPIARAAKQSGFRKWGAGSVSSRKDERMKSGFARATCLSDCGSMKGLRQEGQALITTDPRA